MPDVLPSAWLYGPVGLPVGCRKHVPVNQVMAAQPSLPEHSLQHAPASPAKPPDTLPFIAAELRRAVFLWSLRRRRR